MRGKRDPLSPARGRGWGEGETIARGLWESLWSSSLPLRLSSLRLPLLLSLLSLSLSACSYRLVRHREWGPLVVFMSDFGTVDDSVALCKGVMLGIEPRLRIVDLTHDVTPYSIRDGARYLAGAAPHFPRGTVFVAVVDPGVGSARKPIVARTRRGQTFVLPDNGLLTLVAEESGIEEVRTIGNPHWMRGGALSSTFHGRDIFSPAAALLARGARFQDAGPVLTDWVRLDITPARLGPDGIRGEVVGLDGPYGNLVTNVEADLFAQLGYHLGDRVLTRVGEESLSLPFVRTFSDVPKGEALLYVDSRGKIALAINLGSFAKQHDVEPPVTLHLARKP
jgi:S-adenosylmethionine hydrolase